MAVVPADLKAVNGGKIEAAMFPELSANDLDARLDAYIDEGVAEQDSPASDAATKAWAYFRAFEAVYIRLSSTPSSVTLNDQGSASFLTQQIENFRRLSEAALVEFQELIAPEPESVATGWSLLQSLRHA